MILIGRNSDRTGERRWHLAACALMGAIGYAASAWFGSNTLILVVALSAAATGIIAGIGLFWILPVAPGRWDIRTVSHSFADVPEVGGYRRLDLG